MVTPREASAERLGTGVVDFIAKFGFFIEIGHDEAYFETDRIPQSDSSGTLRAAVFLRSSVQRQERVAGWERDGTRSAKDHRTRECGWRGWFEVSGW
jgi:hypothetical protein